MHVKGPAFAEYESLHTLLHTHIHTLTKLCVVQPSLLSADRYSSNILQSGQMQPGFNLIMVIRAMRLKAHQELLTSRVMHYSEVTFFIIFPLLLSPSVEGLRDTHSPFCLHTHLSGLDLHVCASLAPYSANIPILAHMLIIPSSIMHAQSCTDSNQASTKQEKGLHFLANTEGHVRGPFFFCLLPASQGVIFKSCLTCC